jgi:hypothetical protein
MRFSLNLGRRLSPFVLALSLLGGAAMTAGAGTWGPDFDISGGDVNDTFTSSNGQRFACVNDTNDLYIAFFDNRNKTASDNNFEIYFRRFIYNFGSPGITRVTNAIGESRNPAIATLNWGAGDAATANDSGRLYITWQDARLYPIPEPPQSPKSFSIYLRTFQSSGGVGFGPEIQVSPFDTVNVATNPAIACGDSSRVWIVYPKGATGSPTGLYYAVYNSTTRTMGPEQVLVSTAFPATQPTITATRGGIVHVVWTDGRTGRNALWTKRFVPGSGWTADEQVVFSSAVSSLASLTASYTGRAHLVWRDNRDGNNEIYYKEYVPGVGWDAVDTRLTTQNNIQSEPQVDTDPRNNVYVVWSDQRNGAGNQDIFYRQRMGGVWDPEMSLVGAATDTTNQVQQFPGITHDGFGNAYVTWTDWRLPASLGRNKDVFYKVGNAVVTSVEITPAPAGAALRAYPNPFNPLTNISFRVEQDTRVNLRIYDVHGRLVRTLVDEMMAAGPKRVTWDGRDDLGRSMASGAYYLRLQGGGTQVSRTLNLLK